jgi:hypothetical protein
MREQDGRRHAEDRRQLGDDDMAFRLRREPGRRFAATLSTDVARRRRSVARA